MGSFHSNPLFFVLAVYLGRERLRRELTSPALLSPAGGLSLLSVLMRGLDLLHDRRVVTIQGPQQVFYLPQIEYVFGYVLPPSGLCDVHYLIHFFSVRCFRKYCCDLSRLRDWSTMFLVSVRIVR